MAPATFAGVVGKGMTSRKGPENLVFPQALHDAAAGRGSCPFIHPIGEKDGSPAVIFSNTYIKALNEAVKFTLIGKFALGHPKMELVRTFFDSLHFIGAWKMGLLDGRHLLIHLTVEEDYARLFAKQSVFIAGTEMKLIKWTPDFDPSKEPPVVPIWFRFPGLPYRYFNQNVLFQIGSALGTPLQMDSPTYNRARPDVARLLIERDVTLPDVHRIWVGSDQEGVWQEVVMEHKPYYCSHCRMFGHTRDRCYRLYPPTKRSKGIIGTSVGQKVNDLANTAPPSIPTEEQESPVVGLSQVNKLVPIDAHSFSSHSPAAQMDRCETALVARTSEVEQETPSFSPRDVPLATTTRESDRYIQKFSRKRRNSQVIPIAAPTIPSVIQKDQSSEEETEAEEEREWQVHTSRQKKKPGGTLGDLLDDVSVTPGNGLALKRLLSGSSRSRTRVLPWRYSS